MGYVAASFDIPQLRFNIFVYRGLPCPGDDYTIAIKGILLNFSGHDYPEDQVATLRELLEATQLTVSSPLLIGVFGIQRIVIKDFDLAYETGENFQAFRINAWSDQLLDTLLEEDV